MTLLRHIFISAAALSALASCSDFDDPASRFEPLPDSEATPQRSVLLTEFTGQLCVNCPAAHEEVERYHTMFGDNLISVSIHGDNNQMALIDPADPDCLGSELGAAYCRQFGVKAWPSAVVDWTGGELGGSFGKWLSAIVADIIHPTSLDLSATATYSTADDIYTVEARMRSTMAQTGSPRMMVWLTEDSIHALQMLPGNGYDLSYVHNNVLRAALTAPEGDEVEIPANLEQRESVSGKGSGLWNPSNMSAVVFVYTERKGVTAVVKVPVTITENNN